MTCSFVQNQCQVLLQPVMGCGAPGRSLPSCGRGRAPVGSVGTVLLRERPSFDDACFNWNAVFGPRACGCTRAVDRLGRASAAWCGSILWLAQLTNPTIACWYVNFPCDRPMGCGVRRLLFLAPHRRVSSRSSFLFPGMCLRFDRVSTRMPLSLSPPRCETDPRHPAHSPLAFPLRHRSTKERNIRCVPLHDGGRIRVPSRMVWIDPPFSSCVWCSKDEARPDPHPWPWKILPRQHKHPKPKQPPEDTGRRGVEETKPVEDRHLPEGELIFASTRDGGGKGIRSELPLSTVFVSSSSCTAI